MNKYKKAFENKIFNKLMFESKKDYDAIEELVERATPKKPKQKIFMRNIDIEEYIPQCPNCLKTNFDLLNCKFKYCPYCGQTLDRSD